MTSNNYSSLSQVLADARDKHIAIGHFNISTLDSLWAIVNAAKAVNQPVVIGVSEGERDFVGIPVISAIVSAIKKETGHPLYLNADHCYSLDSVKQVVGYGFDSIVFDAAGKSFDENIQATREVVDFVKSSNPDLFVEAEVGYIGSSSSLLDQLPTGEDNQKYSTPTAQMVADFVAKTGVGAVAPAIGNLHGMLKNAKNPDLDLDLLDAIAASVNLPLVLHGGSGISDNQFSQAIARGISLIHLNTELRVAWRDQLKITLEQEVDTIAPYKLLKPSQDAVYELIKSRLMLFSKVST
jgi:fructose-bisphosphate aldolase, class II